MNNYILEGKQPKQVDDILEWANWFEKTDRTVENTKIGNVKVSTVFLGIDHSFGGGTPLLFETMIFGGDNDGYQDRYATWDEAVKGHQFACEKVNVNMKNKIANFLTVVKHIIYAVFVFINTRTCKHEFKGKEMQPRDADGIVRWQCHKCKKFFAAEYGLKILENGKRIGEWS